MIVVHADWGKDPRKRWVARARSAVGSRRVEAVEPWRTEGAPLERLGLHAGEPGPILIGVDFPIGLPRSYAVAAGIRSFTEILPRLGGDGWEHFYEVAQTADEISMRRPFYPRRPGGTSRQQLADGLDIPVQKLRRACEEPTPTRAGACALFWTLGANQVGKGAIAGWQELVVPLVRDADAALWPFDGDIATLIATRRVTIAETYPTEYYSSLGFGPPGWSKRRQDDRAARAGRILKGFAANGVTVPDDIGRCIADGFGPKPGGEDSFDAVVGLIGMLDALRGDSEAPRDDAIRSVEGWILGQPVG